MHYVPESACEFFQEPFQETDRDEGALAAVAPLYMLTALVGLLLAADAILGVVTVPDGNWLRAPWGYRLALIAAVLGGARILYHSLENVLAGRFGADLALTIACLAAIALGEHQTAGLVVFISLVGEAVEGFTLQQARRAIRRTFEQRPQTAHLVRDGLEREVPVADLQPGDQVVVRAGERIPADGCILSGSTAINESLLTGESRPVEKSTRDAVFAGSINSTAAITVLVERIGDQTALAEMERLVREAASRHMHCERTADRFARWFLPAILALAAVTLLAWRIKTGAWQPGWLPALGVLVVACPCPLVLATPCAVMAALTWLARRGIVVKGSAALERLATINCFVFDKTGTVSEGDLSLGEIVPLGDISSDDLLAIAASAERPSSHPIGRLLRKSAAEKRLAVSWPDEFSAQIGAGVSARLTDGRQVIVGSPQLLIERTIALSEIAEQAVARLQSNGQTPLLITINGQIAGIVGLQETLRKESADVLRELKQLGIQEFALLTGDRMSTAQAAARSLSVFDHVAAEQRPEDKARWIESQRQSHQRIAMIGDGVNDAPALAAADVGLAVCRPGNELAAEAGEILLFGEPLRPLPGLVRLSRALVENIRQSLEWFALGANGIGVVCCMIGWLTPVTAALFHEFGSLLVMLNALRLLWFQDAPTAKPPGSSHHWDVTWERWAAQFSPGRLFAIIIRRWKMTGQVLLCSLAVGWLCSQIAIIPENEAVVVLRNGKYHETLSGGWFWRWPWPFERLIRVRPQEIQTVSVGYRANNPAVNSVNDPGVDFEWTSSHEDAAQRSVPEESLYLTGDEVAVELTAEVQYRIADVRQYALAGGLEPVETLRAATEGVLRAVVASEMLDNVLTEQRGELERRCRDELREQTNRNGLGLEIVAVHWLDVHPPRPVVDAFRQVSDANEQREQAINGAQGLATRTLVGAAGAEAIRRLERSNAPPGPMTERTMSDDVWKLLSQLDSQGERILSGTAGALIIDAEAAAAKRRETAIGQAERMKQLLAASRRHPELSRQQLYWTTVVEALAGKPFTLVDPKLEGRRQLFLGEPGNWSWVTPNNEPTNPRPAPADQNSP